MSYFVNRTEEYHRRDIQTLGWELTVCNTLEFEQGPARRILARNATYGAHLADYLFSLIDENACRSAIEIGGGYGFLTRDFLKRNPAMKATMIDISPLLLRRQKETLENFDVRFVESDFFEIDRSEWRRHDLAILNEIVGDFPTACNLTRQTIESAPNEKGHPLASVKKFLEAGVLEIPDQEPFNANIGAMEAVDLLCSLSIPYIFVSEHSCEADAKGDDFGPFLQFSPGKNPEEIKLAGHSEYTLCFSNLERIGRSRGYETIRGNYTDFIKVDFSPKLRFILTSNSQKDEHEIVRQFVHDLYKYEYLIFIGQGGTAG